MPHRTAPAVTAINTTAGCSPTNRSITQGSMTLLPICCTTITATSEDECGDHPIAAQRDGDSDTTGDERTERRDVRQQELQHRQRQDERNAEQQQRHADADRVEQGDDREPTDVAAGGRPGMTTRLVDAVAPVGWHLGEDPAPHRRTVLQEQEGEGEGEEHSDEDLRADGQHARCLVAADPRIRGRRLVRGGRRRVGGTR